MSEPTRLTPVQWLICIIAVIGFAFDIYEILMLPLIVGPALNELLGIAPGTPEFSRWVGLLLWIPAIAGGIFGLLGGYLTDRLGRRRVLVWSILIYAVSAFAAGFSTNIWMFLILRCTTFIGVCVEFVAAVAWLAELFPDAEQRERVLGYTQAFSSVGGLMVTAAYWLCLRYAESLPAIYGDHDAWRYTLMSGLLPALPLIIIRPFLPESPAWQQKRAAGTLKRPSIAALFSPELRRTTIVTTLMFAFAYGAAFGAIQHMPRIVPGLAEVATLPRPLQQEMAASVQWWQEVGGLVGRTLLAMLVLVIVSRRTLLRVFQVPGPDRSAARLLVRPGQRHRHRQDRHVPRGTLHGGAVQFLGQLSAAGIPDIPAWHGRKVCREHRRTHVRDFLCLRHHRHHHSNVHGAAAGHAGSSRAGIGESRHDRRSLRVSLRAGLELLPAGAEGGGAARMTSGVTPEVDLGCRPRV